MAFDLDACGGYGSGSLGVVSNPAAQINSYAQFTADSTLATNQLKFSSFKNGIYHDFAAQIQNVECLILSCSGSNIGKFIVATITDNADNVLTFNKNVSAAKSWGNVQIITIPDFKALTLSSVNLSPAQFSSNLGGVLAFKCQETLTMSGGHIDLRDKGFPTSTSTSIRPNQSQENSGSLDTDTYSGCENSITKDRLILNCGDGAAFILAKNIVTNSSSRIGNPATKGVQYCRGASDSPTHTGSNIGGSTLLIVADEWNSFNPANISKYRTGSGGRGLARAYLAIKNAYNYILPDEGLYALDTIKDLFRLKDVMNKVGFGNGQCGNVSTSAMVQCFNSYAKVTAISGNVFTISRYRADVDEWLDKFAGGAFIVGRLVMVHQSRKATANDYLDGKFILSRIVAVSGSTVTLKHTFSTNLSNYYVQLVAIPEYGNLTFSGSYNNTPGFSNGAGGICALAANGTMNLSNAKLNLFNTAHSRKVVNQIIGNYSMKDTLPIGQGFGSVFLLAKTLTLNTSTRLGATYSGAGFGGRGGAGDKSSYAKGGGFRGADSTFGVSDKNNGYGGWGGGYGKNKDSGFSDFDGGWHSNARYTGLDKSSSLNYSGLQGAHIFIAADVINNFNLYAMSTGGAEGYANDSYGAQAGGCGYGGGGKGGWAKGAGGAGGYRGGGGGSVYASIVHGGGGGSGSAFVYANTINNQDNTGMILS